MQNIETLPTILEKPARPIAGKNYIYDQVLDWILDKKILSFSEMTNISKSAQAELEENYSLNTLSLVKTQKDKDKTLKYLFSLQNTNNEDQIESVMIPLSKRTTACISTQTGCVCGCVFCATGQMGPGRNLDFSEIVLQLLNMEKETQSHATHVVLMGMGEPLHNYDEVVKSINFFEDSKLNISARRITLSTIGIPDKIRQLADDKVRVELAISLHCANEEKRRELIPYQGLASIKQITEASDYFYEKTKRLPTFEYVLIKDINDTIEDVREIVKLLRNRPCKVNLIAMNGKINNCESPDEDIVERFFEELTNKKILTTIRRSAGRRIDAACGQLRTK